MYTLNEKVDTIEVKWAWVKKERKREINMYTLSEKVDTVIIPALLIRLANRWPGLSRQAEERSWAAPSSVRWERFFSF